jgi:TolB-like protein/Tfp pilus assembly protein PilF
VLIDRAWADTIVEDGNLTVQIAMLRKELAKQSGGQNWIVTVPRMGYRLDRSPSEERPAVPGSSRPVLAVLPFVNLSGDSGRDYLADGIVEDLITALSRFKNFAVISRNSAFLYKGRAGDIGQVADELGVRYLLEGSMRFARDSVRVTTQLVDATTGTHLWATSVDGDLSHIFEFQDRITAAVVGLVEPQIRRSEIERSRRRWPDNPAAYDHFLRALPHFYSREAEGYRAALELLDQAIALEPDYALAHAYASWSIARRGLVSLSRTSPEDATQCLDYARAALQFGGDDPLVLAICGHSQLAIGQMKTEGLIMVRRALAANPNHVAVLLLVGICNMIAGDLDQAEACYRRSHALSPGALEAYESLAGIGFTKFFKRDFVGAIEWLEQSRATLVDWPPTYWMLVGAHAHLGQDEEARVMLARLLEIAPGTSLAGLDNLAPRFDERYQLMRDGLQMAGLR